MFKWLLVFVSEFPQLLLALAPVWIDLDEQPQENFLLEEVFHIDASLGADFLERLACLAYDYSFLGITHHIDHSADVVSLSTFLEFLHHNLAAVRDLLLIVEEDLLPNDLRCEESQVLVCEHILVIPCRSYREILYDGIEDVLEIESFLCRCREYDCIGNLLLPPVHEFQHLLLTADVYLVACL